MAERISVNSNAKLSEAVSRLTKLWRDSHYVVVSLRVGRDRTLDQNALWFSLYQRITEMTQIGEVEDARRICKLHHGVPIMRRDDPDFRDGWNRIFLHLTYEEKLALMGECSLFGPDGFPVTRLFNRAQGVEYTNRVVDAFRAQGVLFDDLLKDKVA